METKDPKDLTRGLASYVIWACLNIDLSKINLKIYCLKSTQMIPS